MTTDHHKIQKGFEKSNFQLSYLPIAARVEIWNFGVVELVGLCVLGCNCGAVRRAQSRRHSCENGALCQRRQPGTASSIGRSIIIFQHCISLILHLRLSLLSLISHLCICLGILFYANTHRCYQILIRLELKSAVATIHCSDGPF